MSTFERKTDYTSRYDAHIAMDDREHEKEHDHIVEAGNSMDKDNLATNPDFPQSAISNTPRAIDADKVDGFDANATPTASNILPLDANKHFPVTVIEDGTLPIAKLKIYETAWTALTTSSTKTFDHGLGVVPKFVQILIAENADGTGWCIIAGGHLSSGGIGQGTGLVELTTTQIIIRSGEDAITNQKNKTGGNLWATSGFVRIVAIA